MKSVLKISIINIFGDVHHIFPKVYLKKSGVDAKNKYNQVANYIYLDTQVNKAIRDNAPNTYFGLVKEKCEKGEIAFGNISNVDMLASNIEENCIPQSIFDMTVDDYENFLVLRRERMSRLMKHYYQSL